MRMHPFRARGKFKLCKLFRADKINAINVECNAVVLMDIFYMISFSLGQLSICGNRLGSFHERKIEE
jgi:hypothetical protein